MLLRGNLESGQRTCSHSFRLNLQTDIVQLSQDHFMVIAKGPSGPNLQRRQTVKGDRACQGDHPTQTALGLQPQCSRCLRGPGKKLLVQYLCQHDGRRHGGNFLSPEAAQRCVLSPGSGAGGDRHHHQVPGGGRGIRHNLGCHGSRKINTQGGTQHQLCCLRNGGSCSTPQHPVCLLDLLSMEKEEQGTGSCYIILLEETCRCIANFGC